MDVTLVCSDANLTNYSLLNVIYVRFLTEFILHCSSTNLQPDVLGSCGDGGNLKADLAIFGNQLTGVDVVPRTELCLDANLHPISWTPIRIGDINLCENKGKKS